MVKLNEDEVDPSLRTYCGGGREGGASVLEIPNALLVSSLPPLIHTDNWDNVNDAAID
jgi:hypothetical protein